MPHQPLAVLREGIESGDAMSAMAALDADLSLRDADLSLRDAMKRIADLTIENRANVATIRQLQQALEEEKERNAILDDIINEREKVKA